MNTKVIALLAALQLVSAAAQAGDPERSIGQLTVYKPFSIRSNFITRVGQVQALSAGEYKVDIEHDTRQQKKNPACLAYCDRIEVGALWMGFRAPLSTAVRFRAEGKGIGGGLVAYDTLSRGQSFRVVDSIDYDVKNGPSRQQTMDCQEILACAGDGRDCTYGWGRQNATVHDEITVRTVRMTFTNAANQVLARYVKSTTSTEVVVEKAGKCHLNINGGL